MVHMRKVPVAPDVKADILARGTPGMSGADLANLVNEAALFGARRGKRFVEMDDFESAKDKIMMCAERRSIFMPQMTTGASNDFERATDMARKMVTQWGMSEAMGTMVYAENEGEVFLGRSVTTHKNISEATMQQVDAEIRRIIDQQYALARRLIEENRDKIEVMAKALLEWETLDADQSDDIMPGTPPRPPKPSQSTQAPQPPQDTAPTAPATTPTQPAQET